MKLDTTNTNALAALGTLTALAASSQAAVVQITLINNQISTFGGSNLNADITGDGNSDVILSNSSFFNFSGFSISNGLAVVNVNGQQLRASRNVQRIITTTTSTISSIVYTNSFTNTIFNAFRLDANFAVSGVGVGSNSGSYPTSIFYLNPISFTDANINGGALTQGWLEVNAFRNSITDQNIVFTRVIFDDASTSRPAFATVPGAQTPWSAVPEPSSLALLALGAGGLLVRRRRQAA